MNFKFRNMVYFALGSLFLALGFLGAFLPILPTTPFLLLASYFFSKASKRVNDWFTSTKIYKKHIDEFIQTQSMTLKKKLSILLPVSTMLIFTFLLAGNVHARIGIVVAIIIKYYYFFAHIKTSPKDIKSEVSSAVTEQT